MDDTRSLTQTSYRWLEGCPASRGPVSSFLQHTCLIILKALISWSRCVYLGLELNFITVLDTPDTYAEMKHNLHIIYSIYTKKKNVWKHEAIICDNAENVTLNTVKCKQMSFLQWKYFVYFTPPASLFFVNHEALSVYF